MQIIRRFTSRYGPVLGRAPLVSGSAAFIDSSHHVIPNRRLALHPVVDSFQKMIEPADHVVANREVRVGRINEVAHLRGRPVTAAMQPWTDQQLLFAAGNAE